MDRLTDCAQNDLKSVEGSLNTNTTTPTPLRSFEALLAGFEPKLVTELK